MTTQQPAIQHWIGKDRILTFGPVLDSVSGSPVSLAGARATWRLAQLPTSTGAMITLTSQGANPAITFTSATLYGQVEWTDNVMISPADTVGLAPTKPPNRFYHELQITDSSNKVSIYASGAFTLMPAITTQP